MVVSPKDAAGRKHGVGVQFPREDKEHNLSYPEKIINTIFRPMPSTRYVRIMHKLATKSIRGHIVCCSDLLEDLLVL